MSSRVGIGKGMVTWKGLVGIMERSQSRWRAGGMVEEVMARFVKIL